MRRTLLVLVALALPAVAFAQTPKQTTISGKVGRSNIEVRLMMHPQVDKCSAAQTKVLRAEALEIGTAHIRANLTRLVKQAGTDASGPKEFFGVNFLGGCTADGTAWLAFPAEGKDRQVTRYAPQTGWSPMAKL